MIEAAKSTRSHPSWQNFAAVNEKIVTERSLDTKGAMAMVIAVKRSPYGCRTTMVAMSVGSGCDVHTPKTGNIFLLLIRPVWMLEILEVISNAQLLHTYTSTYHNRRYHPTFRSEQEITENFSVALLLYLRQQSTVDGSHE